MARIKDEIIEKLKNEVSLVRLMESQGFELKKHGKDYLCRCPFHNDKTPSLVVTPSKNLWNCLGACGVGGSIIDWVIKREGVSFRRAVEILQHDIGLISESHQPVKQSTTKQLSSSLVAEKDEQQALKRVIDFYHETLKQCSDATDYLESRGLNHPELINTFKLGFANRTLSYRLPEKNRKAGSEIRGLLQSVGILRKSGHEHFNGSVVVPVFDENNQIKEVYGRKILGNRLRKGTAQHLYLPGEHEGVFNYLSLAANEEMILCESLIDAMTFWVNGFKNVTSSYGTNGFTEEILNALINHDIKRVLIAYDRDEAGNNAAEKLAEQLSQYDIECYRVLFPKNMDANEYALQMSPASKALGLVIRKAEPMLKAKARKLVEAKSKDVNQKEEGKTSSLAAELPEPTSQAQPKSPIEIDAQINEREIKMMFGERNYRVRGLSKNLTYDQLKVNVMVSQGDLLHVDTLELYNAKQRQTFIKISASELSCDPNIIKKDLGKVLLKLEALQDDQIENGKKEIDKSIEMNEQEKSEAMALLKDKNLTTRIIEDFNQCGIVGEQTNLLMGYLAAVSRKLDKPLAIIIQSTSAAGKSSLMDAVLAMFPVEERVQYSAMTGQSLFYMGETRLKNKILAISEEEGVEQASYALKLLQSEGEVTIASTGKNATTGNLETQEYHVEGPVMLFLTTTAIDIDEELLNRCLVLTVNESFEQTEAIQQSQRTSQTLNGLLINENKKHKVAVHQNAQRLLRPLKVVNPFAEQLTFRSDQTRTRRDHMKYLTLIQSIAYLHQYQREIKSVEQNGQRIEYIEVTIEDIKTANHLAHEVLGRTLDELPPQTRKLLGLLCEHVQAESKSKGMEITDYRFSRKDIRQVTGWGLTQVAVHCGRLEAMEYLMAHSGKRGQSMKYELCYDGQGNTGDKFMLGLIESEKLAYDEKLSGLNENKSGSNRPQIGGVSGANRGSEKQAKPNGHTVADNLLSEVLQKDHQSLTKNQHHNVMAVS
ncbi:MAG: toprim domain-containing protein [Kangiellaceae bacterium]|nr:toprim domain-containing protein [Kangiellaceae bacterium]